MSTLARRYRAPPSVERLRALLQYNPETGAFTWRERPGADPETRRWNARYAGARAGSSRKSGYWYLCIENQWIGAGRVAWAMIAGYWPPDVVTFRDRNPSNIKFGNLRCATRGQTQVRLAVADITRSQNGRWRARISFDGQRQHLGYFGTKSAAERAYDSAADRLYGEYRR